MDMAELCVHAVKGGERKVLVTAVYVEGHAYRKEGASMLLGEDGGVWGSISPGCIEEDLRERVCEVLSTGKIAKVPYDMRPVDDLSWGEHVGCGGLMHLVLEPVVQQLQMAMETMVDLFGKGHHVILTRTYDWLAECAEYRLEIAGDAIDNGLVASGNLASLAAIHVDNSHELMLAHTEHQPWPDSYVRTYRPQPRLVIFGAGPDAEPVCKLALATGFRVVMADWRTARLTAENFAGADLIHGFPQELLHGQLRIMETDFVLLMSHQYQRERELLELLAESTCAYIGIMGTKGRTARLLEGLPTFLNLHSPVGLSIGSDGPEEIAVSIMAELIAIRRGTAKAQSLSLKEGWYYERHRSDSGSRPKFATGS